MISPTIYSTDGKLLCNFQSINQHNLIRQTKIDKCFLSKRGYEKFHESLNNAYKFANVSYREPVSGISRSNKSTNDNNQISVQHAIHSINLRACSVNREMIENRQRRKNSKVRSKSSVLISSNRNSSNIQQEDNIGSVGVNNDPMYSKKASLTNITLDEKDVEENKIGFIKVLTPLGKLTRAIKTINLVLKATTTDIEQSKKNQKRYMTATDNTQFDENQATSNETLELEFSLSDYKMCKEKTLSIEAISVLKMHKSLRTEEQIKMVVIALTTTVDEFSEFPKKLQVALVRHGWYEKHEPNKVIIRQGHAAQNFYFIISGRTQVMVASKNTEGESYGQAVAFLAKGKSFGELALMHGGKRNASVICMNTTELLSVTRDDFIDIFMSKDDSDLEPPHITMLRSLPMLSGWPIDALPHDNPKICLFMYIRKDTILCRDSNTSDWIYIVCTGSCRVMRGLDETEIRHFSVRSGPFQTINRIRSIMPPDKKKKIYIELKILRPGDIFGLESVAFCELAGTDSAMLVSNGAECVAISRNFFSKRITQAYMRKLRKEVSPFPDEAVLFQKLQQYQDWNYYKKSVFTDAVNLFK